MTTIYSADGTTVTRRYRDAPRWHWVPTDAHTGRFVPADTSVGYFPLVEVDRPDDDDDGTHTYSVVRDGDTFVETWTRRDPTEAERAARIEAANYVDPSEQVAIIAELTVAADVRAGDLTDAEIEKRAPLFPPWKPGVQVAVGQVLRYDGTLVEVIQAHPTQSDWAPDVVPALFKSHRKAGQVSAFVQPTGGHDAYSIGDRVTFAGKTYESKIDANVWSPAAYPAGWQVV